MAPSLHAKRTPAQGQLHDPTAATKHTLRTLARRVQNLSEEIKELDDDLATLTTNTAPTLSAMFGVGPEVAGQILTTVGDNPERLHSSSAFAHLCGVAPIQASSGKTNRHRLNRCGDRGANSALYRIAIVGLRYDPRTQAYSDKLASNQKSNKEILRCLKRAIAREIYQAIKTDFNIS